MIVQDGSAAVRVDKDALTSRSICNTLVSGHRPHTTNVLTCSATTCEDGGSTPRQTAHTVLVYKRSSGAGASANIDSVLRTWRRLIGIQAAANPGRKEEVVEGGPEEGERALDGVASGAVEDKMGR